MGFHIPETVRFQNVWDLTCLHGQGAAGNMTLYRSAATQLGIASGLVHRRSSIVCEVCSARPCGHERQGWRGEDFPVVVVVGSEPTLLSSTAATAGRWHLQAARMRKSA